MRETHGWILLQVIMVSLKELFAMELLSLAVNNMKCTVYRKDELKKFPSHQLQDIHYKKTDAIYKTYF